MYKEADAVNKMLQYIVTNQGVLLHVVLDYLCRTTGQEPLGGKGLSVLCIGGVLIS